MLGRRTRFEECTALDYRPTWGLHAANVNGMSELKEKIRHDLTTAMKARDKETTGALRMLLAEIQKEDVAGSKHESSDEEILRIIAREIKKRHESAEVYEGAGRNELAEAELAEAKVFEQYQPQQLDDAQLEELVATTVAEVEESTGQPASMKLMGQVMKAAQAKAAGQVDGKRLSEAVKAKLQG